MAMATPPHRPPTPPIPPPQPPHEVVDISSIADSTGSDELWWEKDPAYGQSRGRTFMSADEKKALLMEVSN
jgi:hypothetical protein